jgi:hypothetical protein
VLFRSVLAAEVAEVVAALEGEVVLVAEVAAVARK